MSSGILCSGSEACRSLDPKDRLCPRHNEGSRSWLFDPARLWKAGPARNPNPRQAERRLRAWLRPPPLVLFRPDPPAWLRPHIHREIPGDRSLPPTPNPETPSSAAQKSDAQFRLAKSKTPRRPSHGLSMRKPPTCHVPTYLANIAKTNESTRGWRRQSNTGRGLRTWVMLANASIQNTTTLQGLLYAAFGGFPAHVVASSCPHGWIPAFAGMTHAGLAGRDAAVVSRRRLSALRAYHIRKLTDGQPDTCHPPAHAEARAEFPARATMPRLRSARLTVPFIHLLYNWIRRRLRRCRVRLRPRRAMLRSNGS